MASLVGVRRGRCPDNVLRKFCERAVRGESIRIVGGTQRFSFLHVRDADVNAGMVCSLAREELGWASTMTLADIVGERARFCAAAE